MNEYHVITEITVFHTQWWPADKAVLVIGNYNDAVREAKRREYQKYKIVALRVFNEMDIKHDQ